MYQVVGKSPRASSSKIRCKACESEVLLPIRADGHFVHHVPEALTKHSTPSTGCVLQDPYTHCFYGRQLLEKAAKFELCYGCMQDYPLSDRTHLVSQVANIYGCQQRHETDQHVYVRKEMKVDKCYGCTHEVPRSMPFLHDRNLLNPSGCL